MVVQWTTAETGTPVVMYGKSATALTSTVQAMTKTYNASDFCGEPANTTGYVDPGMLHYGTLSNLSYSTRYYYQYGDMVGAALIMPGLHFTLAILSAVLRKHPWSLVTQLQRAPQPSRLQYGATRPSCFPQPVSIVLSPLGPL